MKYLLPFFLFPLILFGQQPSHYVLGETELDGIDIYDLLHARNGTYLIATNDGLIEFDGYRFKKIDCPDMLMSSVFNLVEDTLGNVFFHNLSGQIFKYSAESCKLLFTLADTLLSADMNLGIDDLNRLIITSNRIMVADEQGKLMLLSAASHFGSMQKFLDGTLSVCSSADFIIYRLSKGILSTDSFGNAAMDRNNVPAFFEFQGLQYMCFSNSCNISAFGPDGLKPIFSPSKAAGQEHIFRMYFTSNALWFASSSFGVLRTDANFELSDHGGFLFPRSIISNVIEDREGNVLLGTFGKGIYVIPKESTEDLRLTQEEEDVISVAAMEDGSLYFGTQSGKLLRRTNDGQVEAFRDAKLKGMEALFAVGAGSLLIGEAMGVLINTESRKEMLVDLGSVKDVAVVNQHTVLVGSNSGAYTVSLESGNMTKMAGLALRHYAIGYDPSTASIYSGTSKGLLISAANGQPRSFKLNDKELVARDFLALDGNVYAATAAYGVLVFNRDSLVKEWNESTGLASNSISQLERYGTQLIMATSNGIQLVDKNGKVLRTINQADGLNAAKVLDMAVKGDELWVVHSSGVQRVMLQASEASIFQPSLQLKSVLVNDSIQAPLTQHDFSSDQQKFSFELSAISLRYHHGIQYQYRLEGAETAWHTARYSDNIIEYRSLSPGTYTFRAKAVYQNRESQEVSYTFTIATPFYKAWWFYLLVLLGAILMLVLWFKRRLKREQLLAEQQNELNASKLTAIQSQMNPHFIFNALNSIQSLVLKGDVDNSYTYITKFANLIRRTLNYSDKEFIDFSEEIKLIDLYLTLEKLRFSEDFEFVINTNGIEDVMMPPMLIQPFIENALVHGLLHRTGHKRICLDFELGEVLTCTITDNGVGRNRAKAIKERQRSEHESFSVNAIRTRFEILQRYHKGALGFVYEDLFANGVASGTKVVLRIPIKRKF